MMKILSPAIWHDLISVSDVLVVTSESEETHPNVEKKKKKSSWETFWETLIWFLAGSSMSGKYETTVQLTFA